MTPLRALLPLLLLLAPVAPAQGPDATPRSAAGKGSLAELLPAETALFFETRNPEPEEYRRMAAAACLEEPGVKALLGRLSAGDNSFTSMRVPLGTAAVSMSTDISSMEVRVRYVDAEGERAFVMKDRLALGVVGLQPGPVPVDLVAALEVGGDPADAVATLEKLAVALAHAAEARVRETGASEDFTLDPGSEHILVSGVDCVRVHIGPVSFFLAPLAPQVVVTTSRARIEDLLARRASGGKDSLAADPEFSALGRDAIGTGTVTSLLDVRFDHVLTMVKEAFPPYAPLIENQLKVLGLAGLRSFSSVTRVDGRGVSSTTSLRIEGPRRGLARFFRDRGPATFGPVSFAPKETLYVVAGRIDAGGVWDAGMEIGALPLAGIQVAFEQQFGLRLREDLLDLLGPEAALIVATNGGLIPDVGIVVQSEDPDRLVASIQRLLAQVPWPAGTGVKSYPNGDREAHTVIVTHPQLSELPIAPTFGAVDGYVVIAPYPLSFQRLLSVHRGEREGIDANADYAALRTRVPEGVASMSYLDLPRLTSIVYETFVPIMQSIPNPNQADSIFTMPAPQDLVRHLYGRIAWSAADEHGMHWYSHASFDSTGLFLGMLGGAVGATTLFMTGRSPEQVAVGAPKAAGTSDATDASVCLDRARTLRARLKLYEAGHGGALPESLDALRAPHVDDATFLCPGSDRPYVYLGPNGGGTVLMHGYPNGADGKVTVIDRDLNVGRVTPDELSALLRPEGD